MLKNGMRILSGLAFLLFTFTQPLFAQTSATYSITFHGNWSIASTPGGVVGGAHFTTIAGGTHNSSVSFWAPGGRATSGLESLAELGSTSGFLNEVRSSSHSDQVIQQSVTGGNTGPTNFSVEIKKTHPLVTFATMLGPSPDWFTGLSGFSVLDDDGNFRESISVDIFVYDAGTEDGTEFSLSNPATNPQGVITSLKGQGKFSNVRIARVTMSTSLTPPPSAPTVSSIKRASGFDETTNRDSLDWVVTFSESVKNVNAADFEVGGTTTATVTSVTPTSGTGSTFTVRMSGGDLASFNGAVSLGISSSNDILSQNDVALSSTTASDTESFELDNTAPSVSSVSPVSFDESPFTTTITFSESLVSGSLGGQDDVTVTGGSVSISGSGNSYDATITVSDDSTTQSLTLIIKAGAGSDEAGNDSSAHSTTLNFAPVIVPPPTTPSIVSIKRPSASSQHTNSDTLSWWITFSESVTNVDTADFTVTGSTATATSVFPAENSSTLFNIEVGGGNLATKNGVVSLSVAQSNDIRSVNNVALVSTSSPINESYRLDNIAPRVTSVVPTSFTESPFAVTIRFSEPLNEGAFGSDTDVTVEGATVSTTGSASTFRSTVTLQDTTTPRGLTLVIRKGAGQDRAGNASLFRQVGLDFVPEVEEQDTIVLRVNAQAARSPLYSGDQVDIQVVFSRPVDVSGTPTLALQFSDATKLASYESGSGSNTLLFRYTLVDGDQTSDLGYVSTNSLDPAGGQVTSSDGTDIDLTLPNPGASNSLRGSSQIVTAGRANAIPTFETATIGNYVFKVDQTIETVSLPEASGGDGELTYSLDPTLPGGLELNITSRTITGAPTGTLDRQLFTWTVTDSDGDSASLLFSISINDIIPLVFPQGTSIQSKTYIQNSPIDSKFLPAAMGGEGDLTYSISPSLPEGLILDLTRLMVSGTPTGFMEETTYVWTVMDEEGMSASLSFRITVLEDLHPVLDQSIASANLVYTQNSRITPFTLPSAKGGNGQLTKQITPELPPGLTLSVSSRQITGTPTSVFLRTSFEWTATDEDGDSATYSFTLTVLEDLHPSFDESMDAIDLEFISGTEIKPFTLPQASMGNGQLTYFLKPDLPSGLSLDMTSRQVSGTPTKEMSKTAFEWKAVDTDGDAGIFQFHLTVLEDLQPSFSSTLEDLVFTVDEAIQTIQLPAASGGNGDLTYELSPQVENGLQYDASTAEIKGTPTAELATTTYTWTVTDVDGDSVRLTFTITINPAAPSVTGSLSNVQLALGGQARTVDASSVITGTVDSWRVASSNTNIVNVSVSSSGLVTVAPLLEGSTSVEVTATNISGSVSSTFNVSVVTAAAELAQVDSALSMNSGAILDSALNVFKKRSKIGSSSSQGQDSSTSLRLADVTPLPGQNLSNISVSSAGISGLDNPVLTPWQSPSLSSTIQPTLLSFIEADQNESFWSLWGSADLQNFSSEGSGNSVDGSLTSLFLGGDVKVGDNAYIGVALAQHSGSSDYEFVSQEASGGGDLETTLSGVYPYLQTHLSEKFSAFLVGGFSSGEIEVQRSHGRNQAITSDASANVFAGGFDYLLLTRPSMNVSLVGDFGTASLSLDADSGFLANREGSANRFSFGSSISFDHEVENGSMVSSLDIRVANESQDEDSGSGFEIGGNLNYLGDRVDFMLDGRTSSYSADNDISRNSLTGRLRFRTRSDDSGFSFSVVPRWQSGIAINSYDALGSFSDLVSEDLLGSGEGNRGVSFDLTYGHRVLNETAILTPRLSMELRDQSTVWKTGSSWQILNRVNTSAYFTLDLIQTDHKNLGKSAGLITRFSIVK